MAKLSSHDFTFYNEPEKVISGKIKAPVFALENEKVLYRHVFAIALAEFFAENEDVYAILEGLSKELDIERTDIKGCLHKIKWEGSAKPIYSVILYDAVAGGAGHVRRIVTEDGVVFQRVLNRAYQIVNGCKCDPSCYSCIRNYYNQKIHDQLSRKKAAAFLANKLGECIPIQEESSSDENAHNISISGGESAEEYATWEEIFESYGFDGSGDQYDIFGIPRAGCVIMPAIVMPFTYVGKGHLTNPRKQISHDTQKKKDVVTYLFDIPMENELPDYLQYDFGLTK